MAHSGITFPCKLIEKTLPFGYIVESFTGIFLLKRYSIHEILTSTTLCIQEKKGYLCLYGDK